MKDLFSKAQQLQEELSCIQKNAAIHLKKYLILASFEKCFKNVPE